MAQGDRLTAKPREDLLAWGGIRTMRSRILSEPFAQAAATWNNQSFDVQGLEAGAGDADKLPGRITFAYGDGGDTRYYEVTLRVDWRSGRETRSIESTFVYSNVRAELGTADPLPTGDPNQAAPTTEAEESLAEPTTDATSGAYYYDSDAYYLSLYPETTDSTTSTTEWTYESTVSTEAVYTDDGRIDWNSTEADYVLVQGG
jgi:hypothetical protein